MNNILRVVTAVGVFVGLMMMYSSCTIVTPGNVGVIFNRYSGNLTTHQQGIVFKIPFFTDVQSYPTSLRTYTMVLKTSEGSSNLDDSVDLPTKEGQHIKQDISVTYNTSEDKASNVFKSFRGEDIEDIEKTFIRRTIITVAQNIAGRMSLTELISSGRDTLQAEIQNNLNLELTKMGFNLDKVNLGASHLPDAIEKQMQEKMAAQQQAQQAQYELQKQETLAKAAVAKAHGEADASVVLAEGQSKANKKLLETMTSTLIEYKKVEKWSGILPLVTGNANPLINLNTQK